MVVCADVFWDLKIYVSEALARFARSRIQNYKNISVGTFGGLAPPPPQYRKAGYASAPCVSFRGHSQNISSTTFESPKLYIYPVWVYLEENNAVSIRKCWIKCMPSFIAVAQLLLSQPTNLSAHPCNTRTHFVSLWVYFIIWLQILLPGWYHFCLSQSEKFKQTCQSRRSVNIPDRACGYKCFARSKLLDRGKVFKMKLFQRSVPCQGLKYIHPIPLCVYCTHAD